MPKRCSLACDTLRGVRRCELELPEAATVAEALAMAQRLLGDIVDWQRAAVGIYGRVCDRNDVPADGERIEVYRRLAADPRAARRERVARRARVAGDIRRAPGT